MISRISCKLSLYIFQIITNCVQVKIDILINVNKKILNDFFYCPIIFIDALYCLLL